MALTALGSKHVCFVCKQCIALLAFTEDLDEYIHDLTRQLFAENFELNGEQN